MHIVCMQRHVANRNPERALDFANELARLLPFGAGCLDRADGWPITSQQAKPETSSLGFPFMVSPFFFLGHLEFCSVGFQKQTTKKHLPKGALIDVRFQLLGSLKIRSHGLSSFSGGLFSFV